MNVHLTTLGCPKNQVDSELMLGMLTAAGVSIAERPEDADCLIVNTCAFIDRARQESVDAILEMAQLKAVRGAAEGEPSQKNPKLTAREMRNPEVVRGAAEGEPSEKNPKLTAREMRNPKVVRGEPSEALKPRGRCRSLIVTGCLGQRYGAELLAEMPEVDAVLGTSELDRIVEVVQREAGRHDWATSAPPGYLYSASTPRLLTPGVPYAYVKIAEGCDMGCTFCAIPQFRGKQRSRPVADVVAEVEALAKRGVRESILVSQDTLAYGKDRPGTGDIGDLLLALSETAMPWIRPMYFHPAHVNDRLLDKLARARIVPYVDMPVQHGDDTVLRAMRRAVTARRMKDIVTALRSAIPGITLRTTVLVGFPGETDDAFQTLLEFVDEVRFDRLGVFTYSPEDGTAALELPGAVVREVADERAGIVQEHQDRIAWDASQALVGTVQEVLVDGRSEDPAFTWEGRTAGQAPEIDGVVYLRGRGFRRGRFAKARITAVEGYELVGEPA